MSKYSEKVARRGALTREVVAEALLESDESHTAKYDRQDGLDSKPVRGVVRSYDYARCYGFISWEGGLDALVHQSEIVMPGFRQLHTGQRVEFVVVKGNKKGPRAAKVKVIG